MIRNLLVSMASVLVNAVAALGLARGVGRLGYAGLGYAGLALSLSLVSTFNAAVLAVFIRPRIGGINGRVIAVSLGKILIAASMMGAVVYALITGSHAHARPTGLARIVDVGIGVPAAALTFYAAASALGITEVGAARGAFLRKLRKNG